MRNFAVLALLLCLLAGCTTTTERAYETYVAQRADDGSSQTAQSRLALPRFIVLLPVTLLYDAATFPLWGPARFLSWVFGLPAGFHT